MSIIVWLPIKAMWRMFTKSAARTSWFSSEMAMPSLTLSKSIAIRAIPAKADGGSPVTR
ncbi:hypothetical protein HAX54_033722, partial [Datura stramonium]|nr:hypothetical protein [Datura stramonium]